MKKNCDNCGLPYESKDSRKQYCTDSCKTKAYNKRKAMQNALPVSMVMEKGIVKRNNLNPVYEKAKSKINGLHFTKWVKQTHSDKLSSRILKTKNIQKHKPYWQAACGLLGAFGGLVVGHLIVKPFMREKTIETKMTDEHGNTTKTARRVGLAVWQITMLFLLLGAGVALWLFDRHLTKEETQIPNHEQEIRKLDSEMEQCDLSIEIATKGLELTPKFNLPELAA